MISAEMDIGETLGNLAASINIPAGNYRWTLFNCGDYWVGVRRLAFCGDKVLEEITADKLAEMLALIEARISES